MHRGLVGEDAQGGVHEVGPANHAGVALYGGPAGGGAIEQDTVEAFGGKDIGKVAEDEFAFSVVCGG